jgi:hypothetical protein
LVCFSQKPKCKGAAEAAKHPTTTIFSTANIISSALPTAIERNDPHCTSQQQLMARQMNTNSQSFLSPTHHAVMNWASFAALAEFQYKVTHHNIPY